MEEWNRAIDLIEADLPARVDVGRLARVALTSEYHFRRMFASLAGIPLGEYIRRRRLTAATGEIVAGHAVLEVALRYGYGSAEAFTRAFKALHGMTPSEARRPGAVLRSQPQVRFQLRVEGNIEMKHRIMSKDAFRLVGRRARVRIVYEGPNPDIEQFERTLDPALRTLLEEVSDTEPLGLLAVTETSEQPEEDGSEADYWRAAATSRSAPDGLDCREVPAGLWVVFETEGAFPDVLQRLWADAAAAWFPANPYRWAPGPQMLSVQPDPGGQTGCGRLWIPIEAAERT
ncbi:helix-turn-helix domain-containing protein [Arthrobacter sp. B0490]|uniref:AraC family transcriptional regulator n=1 Tax=Arthrobacter sp. B0490 TaxID=2058891 RepID=UPI000CE328ED|nr:helix-turn-helix domain-containing protein [Arthrobacter sp. B0490]